MFNTLTSRDLVNASNILSKSVWLLLIYPMFYLQLTVSPFYFFFSEIWGGGGVHGKVVNDEEPDLQKKI